MRTPAHGFTLVETLVGTALMLVLFLALFGILRASLAVSIFTKASATATSLANVQMEYLRGLSYDALGTVGGIPPGAIAPVATTTADGVPYVTRTFISYVDDPADGLGAYDENGITTDYKRARVSVTYVAGGQSRSVVLVTSFAPPALETTTGGGTLAVNVVDAAGAPVPGATVSIMNPSTLPTVNVTTFTNAAGLVYLPGAATSSDYRVAVSRSGYSSAQTYARDTTNQNPNPGYLTIVKDQTTTQTFAIDLLAHLDLTTFSPVATSTFSDSFANASKIASLASTTIAGGAIELVAGEGSGTARSVATSSPRLVAWGTLTATTTEPADTSVRFHIFDGNGALVPDTVLPGNSIGFAAFPVALSGISTTTYPSLAIGATLTTTGSSAPLIDAWALSYAAGPTPLPNVSFTLTGAKTIGSQGDGTPIYKTTESTATGLDGTQSLTLEWDSYALSVPNYDIKDACPATPYVLAPNATETASLFLVPKTANNLRVLVTDAAGVVVPRAEVTLARTGYTKTVSSSSCGLAYFGTLNAASDYTVTAVKGGYTTTSASGVPVSGASVYGLSFP